ncbi:MAG: DNA polymerase/3'-5' exonuclease PolX [Candidatus Thermoplasmatota archaeon]|nr:DNA polymerase/3'-5' exonuclease PolX [Candidatus Thermoplasmatota archaeon]
MNNQTVADLLYKIADLLDIRGDNFFKTRAYRIAAQKIEVLDEDIEAAVNEKRLQDIPGIGDALAKKIQEFVSTGTLDYFERLKKEIPEGILQLLKIPTLGPKKVAALYKELGITTIEQLRDACTEGKLRDLDGFGEITERNILRGIQLKEKTSGRVLLNVAYEEGRNYLEYLKQCKDIKQVSIAGSLRRWKETIGDLDILASSDEPDAVMSYFASYDGVQRVILQGSTKTSVLLHNDLQVDLRVVSTKSFGAALQYFTGSKEHNVKMRSLAIKQGFKLNEYGLFDKETEAFLVGQHEEEVYKKLGLSYIDPELRENRGEIKAATTKKLPTLVDYNDIAGDFHVHSTWSDGADTIEVIVQQAQKRDYEFIGIADHSQSLKIAQGLSEERVEKKRKEIEKLNNKYDDIHIFCGTECDIKSDGTLDYSNKVLQSFDFVYAAVHMGLKMDGKEMTKRLVTAMQNDYVTFLAHPTGRLIGRREAYALDMNKLLEAAKETNTFLEINAFPDRLDLNDVHAKMAKDRGITCVLGTDAHSIKNLSFMHFGIATARRGWLEKKDILNTYSLKDIKHILER